MATLEQSRKELAGEYERVQKKAFTNWVNSHLMKAGQKIEDLYQDLRDGSKLLLLLELLTDEKLPREKGKMRFHKLQNVRNALDFLQKERKIKLVNIRADEIVDGNPKLILGLTWTLILHFQISGSLNLDDMTERPTSPQEISAKLIKEQLLEWAQKATDCYDEVSVTNFQGSWRDGMAFCAIIDRYRPDILNFDDCDPETPLENLERAFKTAEEELGIFRIVDPEDVCVPKPDDKAVMTYVSFLRHAFPDMPPPRKRRGPVVSVDDYKELHALVKKWIDEKTAAAQSRDFPHSTEELKKLIVGWEKVKSKEMPAKKREMKSLSELSGQLQALKAKKPSTPAIPSEIEYSKLEEDWANLEKEVDGCQQAIKEELERLEGLDALAKKIMSKCDGHEASLTKLEKKVQQFAEGSTMMAPQEASKLASELQQEIEALEKSVDDLRPSVQTLKDGKYHDVEKVEKRVESLASQLRLLGPRLKEASSAVNEAQAVVAMETSLEELEVWLVTCGKFSNNQNIVSQIEEHKEFQLNKLSSVEERMSRLSSSPPPPGLEEKVAEVKTRWEQVVKQTKDRIAGLEPIIDVVVEFDFVKNPLGEWCVHQQEYFESLPPLEVTPEQLLDQQKAFQEVVADIQAHSEQVEKTEEVALKFVRESEPIQSLADRYARKLKSRDSISKVVKSRASEEEEDPSLTEQAAILQTQWEWLKNQASARAELIADLIDKLNQFDSRYAALRRFVDDSSDLLEKEKPVGESAARIEEQMKTCQESRSEISEKQPAVDTMLALGRSILAEPSTTSQNDALMQKLTGFIEDWSELQMAWQNWYNELHANMEQSKSLSDKLKNFGHDIRQLEPACAGMFPATVAMESLDSELKELQVKFESEVVQDHDKQKATYEILKSNVSLLSDAAAAQETFKKFENASATVESYKHELSEVVSDVSGWWGGCEAVKVWLDDAEKTLSGHTPLASSVDILEQQKRSIEKLSSEVGEHRSEMEKVLKSLEELAKHQKLLNPAPIETYKNQMKKRWEAVCQQVECRTDLCSSGKDHLACYANLSLPFTVWIKGAETRLQSEAKLPTNKDHLLREKEELDEFVAEVQAHGKDLDQVEAKGSEFLGCAKNYQSKLVEFNQRVGKRDEVAKLPEHYVDPSVEDFSSEAPSTEPTFDGEEYHNGIRVVAGNSACLRRRYDALHAAARQRKELTDEAVTRRQDFDGALNGFVGPLGELEVKCDGLQDKGESKPAHIQERVETIRSLEVECMALEPRLHEVKANYDLLIDLGQSESGPAVWEGEDEPLQAKEDAEKRYQDLLDKLHTKKELLNAELSNAQAFHGAFEDFVTWLRETERKIQRDDPLKLEDKELKMGLKYLQTIAGDISAHKPVYEGMCVKCQELMEHAVEDKEELQQKLENAQQRWNAVQIVNDDIEVIEETIPKLEAFYVSYNELSSEVDGLLEKLATFNVSAISSDGLEAKSSELKQLEEAVIQRRSKLEDLLATCDLLETPFDQSNFEKNVSELQEKMSQCDQAAAGKEADLKALGRKVHPMEDLFRQFKAWLDSTNGTLAKLSPAATDQAEREQQLKEAKAVVEDVERHREALNKLGAAVKVVAELVDESDQQLLNCQLDEVTGQYKILKFNSRGYPVERWLEDRETQLCSLAPTGVLVSPVQRQIQEAHEFQRVVSSYKSELELLSQLAAEAQPLGEGPVSSKMAEVQQYYDRLKVLVDERDSMLETFMPSVQQYNSSRGAWEDLLCGWEEKAAALPPPGATPSSIQGQIDNIKALQQAISDHEPEFVSLKKGAQKLCEGPSQEAEYFERLSQVKEHPEGRDLPRPGKEKQQETLDDYEARLEALKQHVSKATAELNEQMEKGNKFQSGMTDLSDWLSGLEEEMDGLKVRDPKSSAIEAQQGHCQEMMDRLEGKSADKDMLVALLTDLVAQLPPDSEEKEQLQSQVDELNKKLTALFGQLSQHESNLESAFMLAKGHEGAMAKLFPWVPKTLERLENLGPPPAEPELVEKLKAEIEGLKSEFNSLAPVCAACVENGQSLTEKCEAGEPKTALEGDVTDLQKKWEKLGKLFGDLQVQLTEALVQTQEFQGVAKGLERWIEGMNDSLHQQERIAARVKLIEPQIEGFQPILSDISAYSSTVEQAKAMGQTLISKSDAEEKQKVEARLEALESEFAKLQAAAQARMSRLEDALKRATSYEDDCSGFDKWLKESEEKLSKMEPLSVASQPLKRQLEQMKEFVQEVDGHKSDMDAVTKSELNLFDTEMVSVQLCEEHVLKLSSHSVTDESVLPEWLERPGAPEVIEVGADLRDRYDKLRLSACTRCDEASQLVEVVLSYEAEYDKFNDWLESEKAAIASFASPAITLEEVKVQIEETENRQRDFKNKEEALECVDSKGTELVNMCKDELSQTSARIKLSDLNESWGDTLNSLSTREEKLREGLTLAEKYQGLHDAFDSWLSECEAKLKQPTRSEGDPHLIRKELDQLRALSDEIVEHKSELVDSVEAGHELEGYTDADPASLPDIGYADLQRRYDRLKASVDERASDLEETLGHVSSLHGELGSLLEKLNDMKSKLKGHEPPRVLPADVEKQLKRLASLENSYSELQPLVDKAKEDGCMFSSANGEAAEPSASEDVPSGSEIQQMLADIDQTNMEVGELRNHWKDLLKTSLETARKFEADQSSLAGWIKSTAGELAGNDAVRGVPEGVQEQLEQLQAVQEDISSHQAALDDLAALAQTMTVNCSPDDCTVVDVKVKQCASGYEDLVRSADARKRVLDDGMVQATNFATNWSETMETIAAKHTELEQLSPVGVDIDTVKTQLEEYKELESSLSPIKSKIAEVQTQGKQLKESCASQDGRFIKGQLEKLNASWSQLYSDSLGRKHQLEDALLQLGQFHDALAELLEWIANCKNRLTHAQLPVVKISAIEAQTNDLENIESGISSHAPSVASLTAAGEKLISSSSAENTAEIQQDLSDLNEQWESLKTQASERRGALEEAHERAKDFHDHWKELIDWLADAERRAYADWKPSALPETCQADITKHQSFLDEVQSHKEPIDALNTEGSELRTRASSEDQRMVERMVGDVRKRYEDLDFTLEEKKAQLQDAMERANQFDQLYTNLHDQLMKAEEAESKQEPIHSEVEAVKQQMEEHKDVMKSLADLEAQLDELDGWGQLLIKDCVEADGDVVQHRVNDLRARWDALNSSSTARLSSLEESLLSLGQFEEAYAELWAWLTDALQQLENKEPITGDPDAVATQLSKHKALQKQLGSRLSSKNAVTRTGKLLMKHKTGEDKVVLKKKLQDLEREWEKVCQMSVARQDTLENAYRKIGHFRSLLGPLRSWMAKVSPSLNESEPVYGDLDTVRDMVAAHNSFQKDLGMHKKSVDAANTSGEHLVSEVLDDPAVTEQDLQELNEAWENICQLSVKKQERLDEALKDAKEFDSGYNDLVLWIDAQSAELQSQLPPDEDAAILQQQIEDHKALTQEVTARQPQYDKVNSDGQSLLQLAHPAAVPVLQQKLQHLGKKWVDLRGRIGARSEALASALLELHGLQDMLEKLRNWVTEAEQKMSETEAMAIPNDIAELEQQLATHEAFQEEMATQQPNMDALNKMAKKQKMNHPHANPEMAKRISSLYKHWQKLWFRSSERHRQLLEARTRLKDIALARSFNFDNWRKRFNSWVDQQKLRVNDLFRRFDGNHDGMLTREEFMKALRASGLAMNQIELEKIADFFDKDRSGVIDLSEILRVLKGNKRGKYVVQEAMSDAEKIENEIQFQVSKCTCAKKFRVTRVAEGQYRFGDSQKLRLVRILRSTVMVRVGGGWEPLEEFLQKHDPCRASGRTNQALRGLLAKANRKPGLVTQEFTSKRQTATAAKNAAMRKEAGEDSESRLSSRSYAHGRKETTVTTSKMGRSSRESTPNSDHDKSCAHHHHHHPHSHHSPPKSSPSSSGRNTPQGRNSMPTTPVRKANRTTAASASKTSTTTTTGASPRHTAAGASPRHTASALKQTGNGSKGLATPSSSSSAAKQKTSASSSRTGEVSGGTKRPTTPSGTSGLRVGQKGSRIPTPKTSKIPTKQS